MVFEGMKYFVVDLFEDNERKGVRILKVQLILHYQRKKVHLTFL